LDFSLRQALSWLQTQPASQASSQS